MTFPQRTCSGSRTSWPQTPLGSVAHSLKTGDLELFSEILLELLN